MRNSTQIKTRKMKCSVNCVNYRNDTVTGWVTVITDTCWQSMAGRPTSVGSDSRYSNQLWENKTSSEWEAFCWKGIGKRGVATLTAKTNSQHSRDPRRQESASDPKAALLLGRGYTPRFIWVYTSCADTNSHCGLRAMGVRARGS